MTSETSTFTFPFLPGSLIRVADNQKLRVLIPRAKSLAATGLVLGSGATVAPSFLHLYDGGVFESPFMLLLNGNNINHDHAYWCNVLVLLPNGIVAYGAIWPTDSSTGVLEDALKETLVLVHVPGSTRAPNS